MEVWNCLRNSFPSLQPRQAEFIWTIVQLLVSVITVKRLVHLANSTHGLVEQVEEAAVELILARTPDPEDTDRALRTKMLLDRLLDGLPVLGFFQLKRGVLLAILSNMLTYLIILIEFKLDDK